MKEIILKQGEVIQVYIYERGELIDQFKMVLNCNLQPIRVQEKKLNQDKTTIICKPTEYETAKRILANG